MLTYILLLALVSRCSGAIFLFDSSEENSNSSSSESSSREGKLFSGKGPFFNLFGGLWSDGDKNKNTVRCGPPDACPKHHCRFDPAVIHGFCCGCSHPTDRVPISCPGNLQCPLYSEPLCSDYNYMMDCCC